MILILGWRHNCLLISDLHLYLRKRFEFLVFEKEIERMKKRDANVYITKFMILKK